MVTLLYILGASLIVAIVSLLCAVFLFISDERLKIWMPRLIAVAVGVLLGDAFLHLLPDAMELSNASTSSVGLSILVGILTFFLIETVLQWQHDHNIQHQTENAKSPKSFATMNLLGDGVHNFVDGVLIASSFLVDPSLGLVTTVAIVLHEIPQEISDIAILIQGGYGKKQAVMLNFLCATACMVGGVATLIISQVIELGLSSMLAFTAGGFIYIATCDLVPLLRSRELKIGIPAQFTATMVGVFSMQSILWLEGINF